MPKTTKKVNDDENVVYLERVQNTPYEVNYTDYNGASHRYVWAGATPNRPSIQPVPIEVYEWLKQTAVFPKGRLVLAKDTAEEVVEDLKYDLGVDELPSVLSVKELHDLLQLAPNTFKSKVKELSKENIEALVDVALKERLDSDSKKTTLAKLLGIDKDLLFPTED